MLKLRAGEAELSMSCKIYKNFGHFENHPRLWERIKLDLQTKMQQCNSSAAITIQRLSEGLKNAKEVHGIKELTARTTSTCTDRHPYMR